MTSLLDMMKSLCVAFGSQDYVSCKKLLGPIKTELIKNNLLIPDLQSRNEAYINDLAIANKFLEIGALVSIFTLDFDSFQSFFAQARVYYFCSNPKLSESENKSKLISLYLLVLLSKGEITKFHSQLEYLSRNIGNLEEDELLSYPINVEKRLMEGSYRKAFELLSSGSKIPEFGVFTETLIDAIREEIARNTEVAYDSLPLMSINALLFFSNEKESERFALERGWTVEHGSVYFKKEDSSNVAVEENSIIEKTLKYAINLEAIV
ncbi:hypothetical protein HG537_0D00200 [Torulaspora globosa]|uniref:PCI domain-containing protein n=1 Tax=Torulaspora globosa TaxID=48254 RepID=A0A7H9HRN7_9SACH|nr:hypothetical protein HG537_0D00200 [Torulaspora sp. CBS 2947]